MWKNLHHTIRYLPLVIQEAVRGIEDTVPAHSPSGNYLERVVGSQRGLVSASQNPALYKDKHMLWVLGTKQIMAKGIKQRYLRQSTYKSVILFVYESCTQLWPVSKQNKFGEISMISVGLLCFDSFINVGTI